jgi:hypothetical protein
VKGLAIHGRSSGKTISVEIARSDHGPNNFRQDSRPEITVRQNLPLQKGRKLLSSKGQTECYSSILQIGNGPTSWTAMLPQSYYVGNPGLIALFEAASAAGNLFHSTERSEA